MNKNTIMAFMLLFGLLMVYDYLSRPSTSDIEAYNRQIDSLNRIKLDSIRRDSAMEAQRIALINSIKQDSTRDTSEIKAIEDSLKTSKEREQFGNFHPASKGEEQLVKLENDKIRLTFSSKGGRLVKAEILGFEGYDQTTEDRYDRRPVVLFDNPQNKFHYLIPLASALRGAVLTSDLYFQVKQEGKTLRFVAPTTDPAKYFEQIYTLEEGYTLKYDVNAVGLQELMPINNTNLQLSWHSFLGRIEKNSSYERTMTSIHYKEVQNSPSYCTCAASVQEEHATPIQWVSHSQQFFNFSLVATGSTQFSKGKFETFMSPEEAAHLKELKTELFLPVSSANASYSMLLFLGPNDYNILGATNTGLESIIPFGWSIFGAIGKYVIRPMFNLLATFIPSYGLIIILLTLIIRIVIYPLQYKMLLSGVKMGLLRPELEAMRKKFKDNPQGAQMEQMKMFQQYGVNPLGGCLPMLLTMPIWISLYRFFPASIEFRQKSFLWAEDLASYDSIVDFSFYIPFYGDHVSLFTLLWAVSMFAFLKYNSSQMDMSAGGGQMKMMMYLQYAFPVIFFFALNSWAAGLTAYMLFSNLLNIAQTYITKNFVINKDKVRAEMEENKKNPKQSGWQQRFEDMTKQMQQNQNKK